MKDEPPEEQDELRDHDTRYIWTRLVAFGKAYLIFMLCFMVFAIVTSCLLPAAIFFIAWFSTRL